MPIYAKESLETLRSRVDLADLVGSYVELRRSGAAYKGLCPFHDEKSPSFVIQKGQSHYHCFGCGAHGDAIQFLMLHSGLSFQDAVQLLADRYAVTLQLVEDGTHEQKGSDRRLLRDALEQACRFYQYWLLHSAEGHQACQYLFGRGVSLSMIRRYRIGLCPSQEGVATRLLAERGVQRHIMEEAGLFTAGTGRQRELFSARITFAIRDAMGHVIGFSARKWREETFGGKYVNTPETPLFKKSQVLFGLDCSRRRIAKEKQAIVVEGQLDCLRMVESGLDLTVAGQGTACGEQHIKELAKLGVERLWLLFDGDAAGRSAAAKVGDLAMRKGMAVKVAALPDGADPDGFIVRHGIAALTDLLEKSEDYLRFMVRYLAAEHDLSSPAGKNNLVRHLVQQINGWEDKVLQHESLRQLARLLDIPEESLGVTGASPAPYGVRQRAWAGVSEVDGDRVLEGEMLRWLLLTGQRHPHFFSWARDNVAPELLRDASCASLYRHLLEEARLARPVDMFALALALEDDDMQTLLGEISSRKVNVEKAEELFPLSLKRILHREWMMQREALRTKLASGTCSEDEACACLKEFNRLAQCPPALQIAQGTGS